MFKTFQTYLIRITTDLVQILQANKPLSTEKRSKSIASIQ